MIESQAYVRSRSFVRQLSSMALGLVAAFWLCASPPAKAGSSEPSARLHGVQSGAISLRQIRSVTTLTYTAKSGGAVRHLKLSTPDGIFPGSFERATLIGEIPDKVVLEKDTYGSRP
jgi:hypothetical protein